MLLLFFPFSHFPVFLFFFLLSIYFALMGENRGGTRDTELVVFLTKFSSDGWGMSKGFLG